MRHVHIDQVDLNLIPALAALLDEQHVSRAAQRVRLTQPAMSRALARLRRVLDDDLLVRGPTGYQLTPHAERLRDQLVELLPRLEQLFASETFEPATAVQDFRLVGSDYAVLTFGPELFRYVLEHSPQSSMCFENWNEHTFDDVIDGTVDLVFYGADAPPGLRHEQLSTDSFVCLVSSDHPLADRHAISLKEYLSESHLVVSIDGGRQPAVDNPIAELGKERTPGLTVPFHSAAILAVRGTRLIATIPNRLLTSGLPPGTVALQAPHQLDSLPYSMIWSSRVDRDPAHAWLRDAVRASSNAATA